MEYAVQTKGIAREFGDVKAVDGIDLNISRGEIYGFLGPNGAGKTTLVRMLITLLLPTRGGATVAGFDVVDQANDVRLRIGAALQEAALDPKQTGRELLRLQGRLYGLSRRDVDTRFNELSDLIDIGDAIDRFVGTYSGRDEAQAGPGGVADTQPGDTLSGRADDGPRSHQQGACLEEVRRINNEMDVTIFLTTQYLEEADALADRVGIINNGQLMAEGTPTELKRSLGKDVIIARMDGQAELAREALSGLEVLDAVDVTGGEVIIQVTNGAAAISRVALALNYVGVEVSEITLRTPTLDDVFLSVAGERMDDAAEPDEVAAGAAD